MARNLLIFDAEYVAELTAGMNMACELLSEAVTSLKQASNHENWKCKERVQIMGSFDELNLKLDRLDNGVNETTRILGNSVSRFSSLESRYLSQAASLSEELTSSHGFSGTVRTDHSEQTGHVDTEAGGALGAVIGTGASRLPGSGREPIGGTKGGNPAGMNIGGRHGGIPDGGHGAGHGGRPEGRNGEASVNLPVTYVPNNPGAVAKGTKGTREVAEAAVNTVVETMTEALSKGPSQDIEPSRLANAYNAGRRVFESSEAIISNPSKPHTDERLTMAADLVTLVQNSPVSPVTPTVDTSNVTQNAERISSALEGDSEASEFNDLLSVILGEGSVSSASTSSSGQGRSFFGMIVDAIKQTLAEGQAASSSSSSSSPITRFFENFVMDEAV